MTYDHAHTAPSAPRYPSMAEFPMASDPVLSVEYQLTREETVTAVVLASAMELALMAWLLIPGPGLAWRKSPSERRVLEIYPDGIAVTFPQSYSRSAWRFYSAVEERANYYAIGFGPGQRQGEIVVLRRVFASPMDE